MQFQTHPRLARGTQTHRLSLTCWMGGSPARLVRRLKMLRSDICRRAATGGMRDSMEGSRVTSAFMSLSSSSSWFSTVGRRAGVDTLPTPQVQEEASSGHQGALLTRSSQDQAAQCRQLGDGEGFQRTPPGAPSGTAESQRP